MSVMVDLRTGENHVFSDSFSFSQTHLTYNNSPVSVAVQLRSVHALPVSPPCFMPIYRTNSFHISCISVC
jgi:hypothetical protein